MKRLMPFLALLILALAHPSSAIFVGQRGAGGSQDEAACETLAGSYTTEESNVNIGYDVDNALGGLQYDGETSYNLCKFVVKNIKDYGNPSPTGDGYYYTLRVFDVDGSDLPNSVKATATECRVGINTGALTDWEFTFSPAVQVDTTDVILLAGHTDSGCTIGNIVDNDDTDGMTWRYGSTGDDAAFSHLYRAKKDYSARLENADNDINYEFYR